MSVFMNVLVVVQVLAALGVIGLVLMQHGKGADMGAAFGSGSSGSLFGATGSANFLSRTTAVLAAVFFLSTLGLSFWAHKSVGPGAGGASVMDGAGGAPAMVVPAESAPGAKSATEGAQGQDGQGQIPVDAARPAVPVAPAAAGESEQGAQIPK